MPKETDMSQTGFGSHALSLGVGRDANGAVPHANGAVPSSLLLVLALQATAIVSGAVATLLEQHPDLTPDQVKALLMTTAVPLPNADPVVQGAGLINLHRAREAKISTIGAAVQTWPRSSGMGSLQLARGSVLTEDEGVVLQGEQTILGDTWDGESWASSSFEGTSWTDGAWNGRTWSGRTWSGESWSGRSWSGRTWSGRTWSGNGWSAGEWGGSDTPSALSAGAWASTLWGV